MREYVTKRDHHPSGAGTPMQSRGVSIWPLSSVPSPDKEPLEAQAPVPQAKLTRDVWDLDNDQLWEVLETLQTKLAQREGAAPLMGSPLGN